MYKKRSATADRKGIMPDVTSGLFQTKIKYKYAKNA